MIHHLDIDAVGRFSDTLDRFDQNLFNLVFLSLSGLCFSLRSCHLVSMRFWAPPSNLSLLFVSVRTGLEAIMETYAFWRPPVRTLTFEDFTNMQKQQGWLSRRSWTYEKLGYDCQSNLYVYISKRSIDMDLHEKDFSNLLWLEKVTKIVFSNVLEPGSAHCLSN